MATARSAFGAKRKEVVSMWFKQLLEGQEKQGTAKAAASAWLGTIYGLRTAARLDGNKEWGKIGDEMISLLEHAFLTHMGKEGQQQIEAGRRLLQYNKVPDVHVAHVEIPRVVTPTLTAKRALVAKGLSAMRKAPAKAPVKAAKKVAKGKGRA